MILGCNYFLAAHVKTEIFLYLQPFYGNSDSYCGSVERNRQFLRQELQWVYASFRRTLPCISVSRGVWRCLFYLKRGRVRYICM